MKRKSRVKKKIGMDEDKEEFRRDSFLSRPLLNPAEKGWER